MTSNKYLQTIWTTEYYVYCRLGQKGVNFGNSLMASRVCYMGSKDEDVVKYIWKKIVFTYAQLDLKFM